MDERRIREQTNRIIEAYLECGDALLPMSDFLLVRAEAIRELSGPAQPARFSAGRETAGRASYTDRSDPSGILSAAKERGTEGAESTESGESRKGPENTEDVPRRDTARPGIRKEGKKGPAPAPSKKKSKLARLREVEDPWN